jgi:DNA uptake protein ComE-like DNA-binding protein
VLTVLPATWALAPTSGAAMPSPAVAAQAQAGQLDINTATVDQLKALPGIGDVYAKKIVAGRPYSSKSQLTSKGILPQAVYNKIKGQIVASHLKK